VFLHIDQIKPGIKLEKDVEERSGPVLLLHELVRE
jgi:hypothetical protein